MIISSLLNQSIENKCYDKHYHYTLPSVVLV